MSVVSFCGQEVGFQYSEEEQWTGTRDVDGKKIYAKSVYLRTSVSGRSDVVHNLNILNYKSVEGYCRVYDTETKRPLPFINESNQHVSIQQYFADSINVFSTFTGNHFYFDMLYTCNNR